MTEHRVRWYARVEPCADFPDGMIPRNRMMADKDWGWDARCSCGWETRTGGAVAPRVREAVADHHAETATSSPLLGRPTAATIARRARTVEMLAEYRSSLTADLPIGES